ncbi:lasso peptide biosynthesis B2 protein [Sphingomonas sp. PB4P5]|uniref:lasso peptide biosynthesis B2 protein n=1 Tax=Parasphingomonas puruogangriensis TaxID=3096155 RepID=UPI002FC8AA03
MARPSTIARNFRTLSGVGWRRQAFAEAADSMLAARIELLVRPFNRMSPRFGTFVRPDDPRFAPARATAKELRLGRSIGWAIRATAPFMPFRSICLHQAIAGTPRCVVAACPV